MIRSLRAFAWLRWRVLLNSLRGGTRRDRFERFSRYAGVVIGAVLLLMLLPLCVTLAAAAFLGGLNTDSETGRRVVTTVARLLTGAVTVAMIVAPLVRSPQGSSGLTRTLLLPIERRVLHLTEVLSSLADPWLLVLLPAMVTLPVGLAVAGAPLAALEVLLAGVALVLALASLGALGSFGARLLFRDRRRGEIVTFVFIALITLVSFVPALVTTYEERADENAVRIGAASAPYLAWVAYLPSEAYARVLDRASAGAPGAALRALAGVVLWWLALHTASWLAYRRLIETPETGSRRRGAPIGRTFGPSLPGLSPAASAVALAWVRTVLRTPRGKMAVYVTPVILLMLGLMFRFLPDGKLDIPAPDGIGIGLVGVGFAVLSLHAMLFNQFAILRTGLTLQFVSPASDRDLVVGNAAGGLYLAVVNVVLCLLAALIVSPDGHVALWLALALTGVSAYVLLAPVAIIASAMFPRPADLSKIGSGGQPHQIAGLVGLAATALVLVPPTALGGIAFYLLDSPGLTLIAIAAWALLACGVSWLLVGLAAASLASRRENLALIAQGR